MLKTKKIKVTEERLQVVDVVCNKCGKSCIPEHSPDPYGLIEQEVHGGYFSPNFFDSSSYRFSMCEFCLSALFNSFKITVDFKSEFTEGKYINLQDAPKYAKKYDKKLIQHDKELALLRKNAKKSLKNSKSVK